MADLDTDEQQIAAFKQWWKNNGISIIAGVVLGVGGIIGWQTYGEYQTKIQLAAATGYAQALTDMSKAEDFISNNPNSVYASDLALVAAKYNVINDKLDVAINRLTWLTKNGKQPYHKFLAQINLGKIYLLQNKPELAISSLQVITNYQKFTPLATIMMADALSQQGKTIEAKEKYQQALSILDDNESLTNIVQLKLNNLH